MKKTESEAFILRERRGETYEQMLAVLGLSSAEYRVLAFSHDRTPYARLMERYAALPLPVDANLPKGLSFDHATKCFQITLRTSSGRIYRETMPPEASREEAIERLSLLRKRDKNGVAASRLGGARDLASLDLRAARRPALPSVGQVLERDGKSVRVVRVQNETDIVVEWLDEEGCKRRAEWTIRPHNRTTDLGEWQVKHG